METRYLSSFNVLINSLPHFVNVLINSLLIREEFFPYRPLEVELLGQYFPNTETQPEHNIKLSYVGADVAITRRHGR